MINSDERIEIAKKRDYQVVKSNELIQKSRFELSLVEQKSIAFICSMIKPIEAVDRANGVPFQLEYEFNIRDYCKVCGIDYNSGKNYAEVKATLKKLRDRSMWLTMPDGSESLVGWLAKVRTNKQSGIAHIKLDEDLVPYLFDLQERFTQYGIYNILGMKSAFSVRLYELLNSYLISNVTFHTFDLDKLKRLLMVEDVKSYENFKDFRRKVLEIAEREINELTDINVSFEPIKKGRKVVQIKFRISKKERFEKLQAYYTAYDKLDGKE